MKRLMLLCPILLITACTVNKQMYAVGGSKADGTVEMAYDVGAFETAKVDFNDAQSKAAQKCKVWGYKTAEAFGGQRSTCLARNGFGNCMQSQVIVPFQCTD